VLYTLNSITKYCEFGEGGGLYSKPSSNFTLIKPPNFVCKNGHEKYFLGGIGRHNYFVKYTF
jgi:hypothetical protein